MCARQSEQINALSFSLQTRFPLTREQTLHFVFFIFALFSGWSGVMIVRAAYRLSCLTKSLTGRETRSR